MMVISYKLRDKWWSSDPIMRSRLAQRLGDLVTNRGASLIMARPYKSLRWDSDFVFWLASKEPESLGDFKLGVNSVLLGFAEPQFSMLSLYEESPYLKQGMELADTLRGAPQRFFIAYPMSKEPEWYLIDFEERKRILAEHIAIARTHPESKGIRSYTTYSYGLGDHEFVVLYETDSLASWSHVTAKLREARARKWIVNEAPILVGVLLADFSFLELKTQPQRPADSIV
jgi:chlorite dismutase